MVRKAKHCFFFSIINLVTLDYLHPDVIDSETELAAEIGDIVSLNDYTAIFSNCCHILRHLF